MAGGAPWTDEEFRIVARCRAVGKASVKEIKQALLEGGYDRGYASIAKSRYHTKVQDFLEEIRSELGDEPPVVTPKADPEIVSAHTDPAKLWEKAKQVTSAQIAYQRDRHEAEVGYITKKPIALTFISDQHISQGGVSNLERMEEDARLVSETPGMYAVLGGDGVDNHCLDTETEVLTQRGWLAHHQLHEQDVVSGIDAEGRAVWQPINRIVRLPYAGDMLHFRSEAIDLLVTPGHRMMVKVGDKHEDVKDKSYRYERANEITAKRFFPIAAPSGKTDWSEITDEELTVVGLLLTDGWVGKDSGRRRGRYCIAQRESNAAVVRDALNAAGYSFTEYTKQVFTKEICNLQVKSCEPLVTFRVDTAHNPRLREILPEKTGRMPEWAHHLSDRQFHVLLDAIIEGDGSINGKRGRILYGKEEFLESVQSVCVTHGINARIKPVAGRTEKRLLILFRTDQQIIKPQPDVVQNESGVVWCLNVPLENFLVRRNGKVAYTGNCKHRAAMVNSGSVPGKEWILYDHYLSIFGSRIAAMISGNHDDWTHDFVGIDMVQRLAERRRIFYAPDFVVLNVVLKSNTEDEGVAYRVKLRHQYRYNSSLNNTHSMKRMWEMDEHDFDIGVICHLHDAAMEPFKKHGKWRWAFRPGSYQHTTGHSRRYGYGWSEPACPTVILWPGEKRMLGFLDVREAAGYLNYLRTANP